MTSQSVPELRATTHRSLGLLAAALLIAGCAAPVQPSQVPSDTAVGTPSASVAPTTPEAATPAPTPGAELRLDSLATVVVEDLSLRTEPSASAVRLGLLGVGEPVYLVSGPVDAEGYQWYQLASVRQSYRDDCGDPAPEPSLACHHWFGWAVGNTAAGDAWIQPLDLTCPATRDTEAFLALPPTARLACAGDEEWTLTVYIAPEKDGRGCYPVWITSPAWLDGSCNLTFLQPDENQYDSDSRIQAFVHPNLGSCRLGYSSQCPFDARRGTWVEVVGHLDDGAAASCVAELTEIVEEAPYPPPDADNVIFDCRVRFVVTDIR